MELFVIAAFAGSRNALIIWSILGITLFIAVGWPVLTLLTKLNHKYHFISWGSEDITNQFDDDDDL